MKLVCADWERQILLDSQRITEWIVESPDLFSQIVQQLQQQINGGSAGFVLSDSEKDLDLSKCAEMIINPFAIDFNDKKIQKKLYAELLEISKGEELYLTTQEILNSLNNYFLQLESISGYELETDVEVDMLALFKAMGIQVQDYAADFFETLIQYIKVMADLMKKKLIIFVNIRSYLNDIQIEQVSEIAVYNEIAILFIENIQRDFSKQRRYYIIDKDGCEIY
jgi:CRISPR type II-A-associated protein Csn2